MIKIMETLKEGENKNDLPENIRPQSGYGNTYAKLWWNKPSTTITREIFQHLHHLGVFIQ